MSKKKAATAVHKVPVKGIFDEIPYFPFLITALFLLLAGTGMYHHEMWRDEHQAWLVARDAASYADLYQNMRYEGNPMLWHTFLWIFAKITWNPVVMQVFHLLIAAGFVFLLHRFSPFSRVINTLITFNYFLFYEYAVISRGYGLGLLLVFIACILFKKAGEKPLWTGLTLFLLANTSIYGMLMGTAVFGILFLENYFGKLKQVKISPAAIAIIGFFWLSGSVLSVWQVMPEPDNTFPVPYARGAFDINRLWFCVWRVFSTWFSVPDVSRLEFWNTSFFISDAHTSGAVFPLMVIAAFALMFIQNRSVFIVFTLGICGLLGLFYYSLLTHGRYLGHFMILLLLCLWLKEYFRPEQDKSMLAGWGDKVKKFVFPAALAISAAGGILAFMKDVNVPFSGSTEAVTFLKQKHLTGMKIIGATDFVISCIPSELQNRNTYYTERGEWGTFVKWDSKREKTVDFNKVIAAAAEQIRAHDSVLVILSAPPNVNTAQGAHLLQNEVLSPDVEVHLIKMVTATVVKDEQYYIYMAKKPGGFTKNHSQTLRQTQDDTISLLQKIISKVG
ncbi:MAG: hypothetical protein IT233_13545 [Bacteroidia bacterium]|nr:hypothetical protein [Bacteroidia bacterium]